MKKSRYLIFWLLVTVFNLFSQENNKINTYDVIEKVPVFRGCKGNNEKLKNCFNKQFKKHFVRRFNGDLPNNLNLSPGKKTIDIVFRITKKGKIDSISVNASHKKIELEVIRVLKRFPKLIPGKLRGIPVAVKYHIPIYLFVEESRKERRSKRKAKRKKL